MNAIRHILLIALFPMAACGGTEKPEHLLAPSSTAMCSPFQSPTPEPAGTAPGSCELPSSPAAPALEPVEGEEVAALTVAECSLN